MVKFLVKQGIDSISVNADVAKEISELVRDLEGGKQVSEVEDNTAAVEEPQKEETTAEENPQVEPIDNKESIKDEIQERETLEQERIEEMKNPEPIIEDLKEPVSDVEIEDKHEPEEEKPKPEYKKLDIFK